MLPNATTAISPLRILVISLLCASIVNAEIAEFGACYQEINNSYRCAFNSTYCNKSYDEEWLLPYQLKRLPGRKPCSCDDTHVGNCVPNHGYRGACALEQSACPADDTFQNRHWFYNDGASCQCHGMTRHPYSTNTIKTEQTMYGACQEGDDFRCVVYSNSCEVGEIWRSPEELESIGISPCTCDKVRTGSCVSPFGVQCVVDSESCDDDLFQSPFVTMTKGDDCFLCAVESFDNFDHVKSIQEEMFNELVEEGKITTGFAPKASTVSDTKFYVTLIFMVVGITASVSLSSYLVHLHRK